MSFKTFQTIAVLALPVMLLSSCANLFGPKACLEASNLTPQLGEEVTFINCSKRFKKFTLTTGDGGFIDSENAVLAHTYESPGVYTVTLNVADKDERNFEEISTTVTVVAPPASAMFGAWDLQRIETVSYHGDAFGRDYGDYTLESTQSVGTLRYSFTIDTFMILQMPDSIEIYSRDWFYDYLPQFPEVEIHYGFGPGFAFNLLSLDAATMVGRTRNNDGLYDIYYFDRALTIL